MCARFCDYEDTNLYNDMGMTAYDKEKVIYEDITPCPHFKKAYKSYRNCFFEKVKMQKVSFKG